MDQLEAQRAERLEDVGEGPLGRPRALGRARGGYIYHSDHSVPPTVSFEQYNRVMELVKMYGA